MPDIFQKFNTPATLYRIYRQIAGRYRSSLGNYAEDLGHNVIVAFLMAVRDGKVIEKEGWFWTVAARLAQRFWRNWSRNTSLDCGDSGLCLPALVENRPPDLLLEQKRELRRYRPVLLAMSDDQWEVLISGESRQASREVAHELNLKPCALRQRRKRLRDRLKAA